MSKPLTCSFFARYEPIVSRLGLHWNLLLLVPASIAMALLTIYDGGNLAPGIGLLGLTLFLVITLYRLDWGFFIFIGLVMLFDHIANPDLAEIGPSFTFKVGYFENIKAIRYLPSIGAAVMNPMEMHLALLFSLWVLIAVVKREVAWNRVQAWGAALLFCAAMTASLAYGLGAGGALLPAIWEVRALFYLVVIYFFVPQIIHTRAHIQTFLWVCIGGITFKAIQGFEYFALMGFSMDRATTFTNHEDPVFMLVVFALLIGLILFKAYPVQRWTLVILLTPLMLGFYLGQRRAAYAAVSTTLIVFVVLLSGETWKRFMRPFIPLTLIGLLYLAAFWNSTSQYGTFAQIIKSGFVKDESQMSREDYYSNLYRDIEKYNLAMTARRAPVLGIGFGQKYDQPIQWLSLGVDLLAYLAHCAIFWLLVKMGAIGFFCFFFFLNAVVFYGAAIFPRLHDPYLKAVCLIAIASVLNQVVVSYFDLQLTYYRNMIFMGAFMGILSRLEPIDRQLQLSSQPGKG